MLDYVVHEEVVDLGLSEGEVASVGNENVVRFFGLKHAIHDLLQMVHLFFCVVAFIAQIEVDVIVIVLIEGETLGPAVVATFLRHHNGEDILFRSEVCLVWSPDLHLIVRLLELLLFFGIKSREKHGIETHVLGQSGVALRYPEGVELPTYVWIINVQFLLQELMTSHKVVNDVICVSRGFIWSRHATVDNLKLFILDQSFDLRPSQIILPFPPHLEELYFGIGESTI